MDLGLARRPPPDPGDGCAAAPWTGSGRVATTGQLWVQEERTGLPTSFGSVASSSSPASSEASTSHEKPRSGRGVADLGCPAWPRGVVALWLGGFLVFV
jgi:hypothetical protein